MRGLGGNVEMAVEWLLEHGEDEDIDDPIPMVPRSALAHPSPGGAAAAAAAELAASLGLGSLPPGGMAAAAELAASFGLGASEQSPEDLEMIHSALRAAAASSGFEAPAPGSFSFGSEPTAPGSFSFGSEPTPGGAGSRLQHPRFGGRAPAPAPAPVRGFGSFNFGATAAPAATAAPLRSDRPRLVVGQRVRRGPDWKWRDQDGGKGSIGTVTNTEAAFGKAQPGWVSVTWDGGRNCTYRDGAEVSGWHELSKSRGGGRVRERQIVCLW